MTQPRDRRMSGAEGATQTAEIMAAAKRLRQARGWSAQRVAEEMTAAGVPWDRSIVASLESGRRKSLRVHELLALCYVLDAETPLDLLVPEPSGNLFPVTPSTLLSAYAVRAWFLGKTGPLRQWTAGHPEQRGELDELRDVLTGQGMSGPVAENIIRLAVSFTRRANGGARGDPDVTR